ncbi:MULTISPECIES: hypothetical protein [unclassified Streptomyces]|uniref:hypothetical protein n=1 Tax=unclassified Streptomyces TaxID=2593676 RepID=UPI003BB745F1
MTDIERAAADGVDKGIAVDPERSAAPARRAADDEGVALHPERPTEAGKGIGPDPGRAAAADKRVVPDPERAAGADTGVTPAPARERRGGLVPTGEREELEGRLRHALTGFVDEPRAAVEEADHVLEDLTARLAETLASHRRTLRTSWQGSTEDTERLRLALRDYRETAERLLKL